MGDCVASMEILLESFCLVAVVRIERRPIGAVSTVLLLFPAVEWRLRLLVGASEDEQAVITELNDGEKRHLQSSGSIGSSSQVHEGIS